MNFWKGIAMKKEGEKLNVPIPQRQFIGPSKALNKKLESWLGQQVEKLKGEMYIKLNS
jgi:hypothetical protein